MNISNGVVIFTIIVGQVHTVSYKTPDQPRTFVWRMWSTTWGYPGQALDRALEGLRSARDLSHPFTLAWALRATTLIRMARGEEREACALCDESIALCIKYGFDQFLDEAIIRQGLSMVRRGLTNDGIDRIHEGLAITKDNRSLGLTLLAAAYCETRQGREGLASIAEAQRLENESERRSLIAWLHRLKGELLLIHDGGDEGEAEHCFRQSIAIARSQSDKSQELASTTHLARLLTNRNRRGEACAMLAEIYNWFTEGFDTIDLKDAKALLDELNGTTRRSHRSR